MPDFDFSGMSWRSFEHLVQALAVAEGGSLVSVFGDGRDGGREATFDGPSSFGSDGSRWDGYGVIQAKFRQRSNVESDGDWALAELRKELKKYDAKRNLIRFPQYYIFATNVVLSPVPGSGGKDRVREELAKWTAQNGVRESVVWDYDQLCALLSKHDGIRRTFAAWTTPGDVLAKLLDQLDVGRKDLARIAVQYLQKEFRRDQFAKLQQAGHLNDDRVPLANVFVDLPAEYVDSGTRSGRASIEGDGVQFIDELLAAATVPIRPASVEKTPKPEAVPPGRMVLLGGPGQGKTTVGQYACQLYRARLLTAAERVDLLEPQTEQACNLVLDQCGESKRDATCSRFPIRIVLSEYAKSLAESPKQSVMQYLTGKFNERSDADLSVTDLSHFLQNYPFLLVFDGLDEVPASSNRDQVLESIHDFEIDIFTHRMDAFLLVTTRPQGYNEELSPNYYKHLKLVPLSSHIALDYGTRLSHNRYGEDSDRAELIIDRLREAAQHPATSRLMKSPLQVTIMAFLVDQFGRPPDERWGLFHQYYELICRREIERDIASSLVIRELRPRIDTVHRLVGLLLQSESERTGGTSSKLSLEQFRNIVTFVLESEGFRGERLVSAVNNIERAAADRLVFLVGLEDGEVGFEVRSLQEFMAGEAVLEANDLRVEARLRRIAGNDTWLNVFLFAAGKCFAQRQYLRPLIVHICSSLNDVPGDKASRLTLVGSRLALSVLEEGSARNSPAFATELTRIALRLLSSTYAGEWGIDLASVCSHDTVDVYREVVEPILAIRDPARVAPAWECWTRLADDGRIAIDEWLQVAEHNPQLLGAGECFWHALYAVRSNEELIKHLAGNLHLHDPEEIRMRFMYPDPGHPVPPVFNIGRQYWKSEVETLISSVQDATGPRRSSILSISDVGPVVVNSVQHPANVEALHPLDTDGMHYGWHLLENERLYSLSPNKDTLAAVLRCYAENFHALDGRTPAVDLSWPAVACFRLARTQEEMYELAKLAASGILGDVEDWRAAEAGWAETSPSIEELAESFSTELPFGRTGYWWGAVLASETTEIAFDYGGESHSGDIFIQIERLKLIDDERARRAALTSLTERRIEPLVDHIQSDSDSDSTKVLATVFRSYIEVARAAERRPSAASSFLYKLRGRITNEHLRNNELARLVAEMCELAPIYAIDRFVPAPDDSIRVALAQDPQCRGLIVLVAQSAALSKEFSPFDIDTFERLLPPEKSRNIRRSILVVKARMKGISDPDFDEVVKLTQRDFSLVTALASALRHEGSQEDVESLVLSVYGASKDKMIQRILLTVLKEEMAARTTTLSTLDGWRELDFPVDLFGLRGMPQ